ncbi:hypothetical protein [Mycobacterium sp. HNNTM2301]|uniref:hypothetical protein n=1 Tax=Mycobacterium hainanense TaxID=3289775 RepID=UPI0035A648B6
MTISDPYLASIEEFVTSMMDEATKLPQEAVEPKEPRCRICRDETVRVHVNELLDWRGAPIYLSLGGKAHTVTYMDILREVEPLNAGRDERHRITYDSLRIHAKRHHDPAGIADYWQARIDKMLGMRPGNNKVQ